VAQDLSADLAAGALGGLLAPWLGGLEMPCEPQALVIKWLLRCVADVWTCQSKLHV